MKWIACADRVDWEDIDLDVLPQVGWCRDPSVPDDIDEVGFIGCVEDLDRAHLERRLRSEGFDPMGTPVVLLTDLDRGSLQRIMGRVSAMAARVAEYESSGPEHLKPIMPPTVSRRSFLTFHSPIYRSVPHPNDLCSAGDGCRACVDVCPRQALEWSRGAIQHDRLACTACGRCISICPIGAMISPAHTPAQLHAELAGLASAVDEPFGVVYGCERGPRPELSRGWYEVVVPCVGMLPAHWLLGPLLLGATAVDVAECGCGLEQDADQRVGEAVVFARSWLDATGIEPVVRIVEKVGGELPETLDLTIGGNPFAADGAAAVAAALGPVVMAGEFSPLGVVTIDEDTCTGCEMCSTVCPTSALRAVPDDGELAIEFNPSDCTACHQCVARCPEIGAISVRPVVDTAELSVGRRTLILHRLAKCVRCGGSVAPEAALKRIAAALSDDAAALKQVTSLCLDCRGTSMVF